MAMTRPQFEQVLDNVCKSYGIKLVLNDPQIKKDNGYSRWNEVHLGTQYKNNHIFMAVAFHEVGHSIINLKREKNIKLYNVNSSFYEEFKAWDIAQRLYSKYIGHPFTKQMGNFVLTCLKTHSQTNYSFKDVFGDEMTM